MLRPTALRADQVSRLVDKGLQHYQAQDFVAAHESFTAAAQQRPGDPRIHFDRACVLAAQGDREQARAEYLQAALAEDDEIAVRAHYNLGCLAADAARDAFGDSPEQATAEQRDNGRAQLTTALGHFRECLRINGRHQAARHNIETIRLWLKQMEQRWQQEENQQPSQKDQQSQQQNDNQEDSQQNEQKSEQQDSNRSQSNQPRADESESSESPETDPQESSPPRSDDSDAVGEQPEQQDGRDENQSDESPDNQQGDNEQRNKSADPSSQQPDQQPGAPLQAEESPPRSDEADTTAEPEPAAEPDTPESGLQSDRASAGQVDGNGDSQPPDDAVRAQIYSILQRARDREREYRRKRRELELRLAPPAPVMKDW
ncbi:MAG: hypothetical protein KDA60_08065 [Planctomycetales bacterium]|nr:hypothetical protein [Planctomycetales bacterium]